MRPLEGLRVVEAPGRHGHYAGRLLAQLGAEVLLVEPPWGAAVRREPPLLATASARDRSLQHLHLNDGKRGVTLDPATADGRALLWRLLRTADACLLASSDGGMPPGWPGPDELTEMQRLLVVGALTPFGRTGPKARWRATDLVAQAAGGIAALTGFPDDPPARVGGEQGLHMGSIHLAGAVLAGLATRERTGRGIVCEVSLQESVAASVQPDIMFWDLRGEVRGRYGEESAALGVTVSRCLDGWVATYLVPWHWDGFVAWAAEDGLAEPFLDPRWQDPAFRQENKGQVDDALRAICARRTAEQAARDGQARRLFVFPVHGPEELLRDPQLVTRGYFRAVRAPDGRQATLPGSPWRMNGEPPRPERGAPRLGQDNVGVWCEELGLARETLAALAGAGVV